jgi:fatty acid desaturase
MSIVKIQDDLRNSVDKSLPREWLRVDDRMALRALIMDWAMIVLTLMACSTLRTWWAYLLGFTIIGCSQYALFILGHDAIHGSLLADKQANDLVDKWLIHGPLFMALDDGRRNHLEHHKLLGELADPDRYIHTFVNKDTPVKFKLFCTGLATFGRTVMKVSPFGKLLMEKAPQASEKLTSVSTIRTLFIYATDRLPVMVAQLLIVAFMFFVLHLPLWSYLLLWIAPIYFCVFLPDEIRAFCEHAVLEDPVREEHRLITFLPPLYERLYFSPHNMNYHAEHHLWPRIPHYNLPKVRDALLNQPAITVRQSYVVYLAEVMDYLRSKQIEFKQSMQADFKQPGSKQTVSKQTEAKPHTQPL